MEWDGRALRPSGQGAADRGEHRQVPHCLAPKNKLLARKISRHALSAMSKTAIPTDKGFWYNVPLG
jgi:hypothetical protein